MADINKFYRSKERITDVLNYLLCTAVPCERTKLFIQELQKSISIIEHKIEEFERKDKFVNN
jgi:hypothetical protein